MKIPLKTTNKNEVILELHEKQLELEEFMESLLEIIRDRDTDLIEHKKETVEQINNLSAQLSRRDDILKSQASIIRQLAGDLKNVSQNGGGLKENDIKYIMKLVKNEEPHQKQKRGFFSLITGGNK